MATTKSRTTTTKKTTTAAKEVALEVEEPVVEEPIIEDKPIKKQTKDVDVNDTIMVVNGFNGRLVYKSKRTGEKFVWSNLGDEQEMEIRELRNAKNSAKGFFIKNWFMFKKEDQWIIDYLTLGKYYSNSINIDDYDKILMSSANIINSKLANVPEGQKESLANRARTLIQNGDIDSNRSIAALESVLGAVLVER